MNRPDFVSVFGSALTVLLTLVWHAADPADFRKLSGPWAPEQPLTTAYTVNLETPVVAGRIFLRTETGTILCYDLRQQTVVCEEWCRWQRRPPEAMMDA